MALVLRHGEGMLQRGASMELKQLERGEGRESISANP